ncbi:uncharacterized protein LOC120214573 [Hibiscus syriacus]|uniref:uncharacterized protein LOC120214573 n=1 Tax=Hibiscus syriacus TaxID=106335 RepID=UPI0019217BAB|nr:uncharacterized protein LOC120214573 [Hibiscus syriacus]
MTIDKPDETATSYASVPQRLTIGWRMKEILISVMRTLLLARAGAYWLHALTNKSFALWKPSQTFNLIDMENVYFLAKFQNENDYEKFLTEGPWIIYGQYLTVQSWTRNFSSSRTFPTTVMAWIRFPGLPEYMFSKKILTCISNLIGRVSKLDWRKDTSNWRCFARVAAYIDLKQPLVSRIMRGNKVQAVEFENLPLMCFSCGRFGHLKEAHYGDPSR